MPMTRNAHPLPGDTRVAAVTQARLTRKPPRHATSGRRMLYTDDRLTVWSATVRWVRLSGEIDLTNSEAVALVLADAQQGDDLVLVDVGQVTFIDLSGLRALALLPGTPPRRGIRLVNKPPFMRRLLRTLGGRPGQPAG
ncbi:STAS domain-containing protein [Planotetraspora sp. A-T 1434]|uniref:STAS domain-containing protein n=1 Tax=Planotetraspora sp. A-T 1434 TaxID=2979219 RepID=UPI0021C1FFAA|nr:STAS domain-containing protein [Planotetraspora sp. A-T 1434]MCT9932004.1 STAS domain-containing protein [Planotetraspora sp. A-T 1434]